MRRAAEIGGIAAALVLIAFGIASIAMGANGRSTVNKSLSEQKIVGTPDMTPSGIRAEMTTSGLNPASTTVPSCSVANVAVTDGTTARCFAQYMKIHALEATGGKLYSQMPRYATANGQGTNEATAALKEGGKPVENQARNVWIQETALSTALNAGYMASQTSLFGIVVGIALLLSGIGFAVLALGGALRRRDGQSGSPATASQTLSASAA